MKTSELINEIAPALVLAQSQMGGAKKDSKNPFFKSNYSDLTSVMQAVSVPFSENDLCFIQGAEYVEGRIAVATRIIHKSGQWIESTIELPAIKNDPQAYGSAVTYAKRYGLQAMAGVPSIDDDAQYASAVEVKHAHAAEKSAGDKYRELKAKFDECRSLADLHLLWGELSKEEMNAHVADKDAAKARLQEAA